MNAVLGEILMALKSYLYGMGWLTICVLFAIIGFRVFDYFCPVDLQRELEQKNLAVALFMGLFLLGLTFGILYLAAHIS